MGKAIASQWRVGGSEYSSRMDGPSFFTSAAENGFWKEEKPGILRLILRDF
jgi:hypothetical protein